MEKEIIYLTKGHIVGILIGAVLFTILSVIMFKLGKAQHDNLPPAKLDPSSNYLFIRNEIIPDGNSRYNGNGDQIYRDAFIIADKINGVSYLCIRNYNGSISITARLNPDGKPIIEEIK